MSSHRYSVVDVFTTEPLAGNALAVFPDASGLSETEMQKIAREINLSETAFVLPATRKDCKVRVRIFTPARELPFAGHPTIGTAFVLLENKTVSRDSAFVLEEEIGPIQLRIEGGWRPMIWLRTPPFREGRCFDARLCAVALGLEPHDLLPMEPQLVDAGNPTVFIAVRDKEAVDRAWLDEGGLRTLKESQRELFCVYVFTPTPDGAYSRMFAPVYGILEDPATGSSAGPLAIYMMRRNLISGQAGTRLVSEQGTRMGRRSLLHIELQGNGGADGIYVGGHVTPIAEAVMTLDSHCATSER
jgi:trans-2,3-dihydro-3-hydroxyanthranilate isomerase